jgi:hypothetical protein
LYIKETSILLLGSSASLSRIKTTNATRLSLKALGPVAFRLLAV